VVEVTDNGAGNAPTESVINTISVPVFGTPFASVAFNSEISPYLFAMLSNFDSSTSASANTLYILNPATGYSLVNEVDLTTSIGAASAREIALDAAGNLFIGGFGGVVNYIPNAAATATTLADNTSVLWHTGTFSNFSGLDIGIGGAVVGQPGDFNNDGKVDAADYTVWRDNLGGSSSALNGNGTGAATVVAADYDLWKTNFGMGAGSGGIAGGAVPEPTSVIMLLVGLAGLAAGRRSAR
jgi:hypothetical protein